MAKLDVVQVRARITIGNDLTVETPYIQSFNVTKTRGQLSSFSASLKVEFDSLDNVSGEVVIEAGTGEDFSSLNKIYTGIIKKATISPCWDDPGYVILNINGTDILSLLQGKKYSRRCRASKSTWVSIDGVSRKGLRDTKFDLDTDNIKINGGNLIDDKANHADLFGTAPSYDSPKKEEDKSILINVENISNDENE